MLKFFFYLFFLQLTKAKVKRAFDFLMSKLAYISVTVKYCQMRLENGLEKRCV